MHTGTTELAADGDVAAPAVEQAAAAVVAAVAELDRVASGSGSRGEWLAVVGACQRGMNRLAAVQDVAVAAAARVEQVWCEDGTLGEVVHGPGRIALDAADLVAPLLGASHHRAASRVEEAVRLTGWEPVPVEATDTPARSGLEGLHQAMRTGRLDGYRAGVVAFELSGAPAQVADAVVAALEPWLESEPGPGLRRRTRRLLARISPDLLRQRATRARSETGLRRWVSEPGVDTWHGTFPSEDSATAWAAVDALARRYVTDGTCATIERAHGKALTDLVTGQADITVKVVLTVPASPGDPEDDDTGGAGNTENPDSCRENPDGGPENPDIVGGPGNRDGAGPTSAPPEETAEPTGEEVSAHPGRAAGEESEAPDPLKATDGEVRVSDPAKATDGEVRVSDPAKATDGEVRVSDPARAAEGTADAAGAAVSKPAALRPGGALRVPGSGDDLVAVTGSRPGEPVLVPAVWLAAHTSALAAVVTCHAGTGARLDPDAAHASDAYRPGTGLVALVKARDGRCRFPGCSVAARFCDLDHVRPWPTGPTEASNLMCLCRRHHRVKQAPGWRVRLHLDGRASWTDPTGRVTVTEPVDALDTLVLHPDPDAEVTAPVRRVGEPAPGELPSALEDAHDHQLQDLEVRAAALREARRRDRDRPRGRHRSSPDRRALLDPLDRRDRHHLLDRCRVIDGWLVDGLHHLSHRPRRATYDEPPF